MLLRYLLSTTAICTSLASPSNRTSSQSVTPVVKNGITKDGPWTVTKAELDAVPLVCPHGIQKGKEAKNILFIAGTGCKGNLTFIGGLPDAFALKGYSSCWINVPYASFDDAQLTSEYVAHSIRQLYFESGKIPIFAVGHSQGSINIQWALNFFPSTRPMVVSFASLSGDFQGAEEGIVAVFLQDHLFKGSLPSVIQQTNRLGKQSNFLQALNRHGNMALVPTTSIYGKYDEALQPVEKSTSLGSGGAQYLHIAVQEICPDLMVEHVMTLVNRVGFYLALDAFENKSAANVTRVIANYADICRGNLAPGVSQFAVLYLLRMMGAGGKIALRQGYGVGGKYRSISTKVEPKLVPYAVNQP